ncbi:hypothetical protein MHH81_21085 [Psychrobacillus sp. FSL H8-0484]|uniref:hypothetical protein n=1 Tax=Psychrobacillus sp. FSL H8-0484 TaxID=2921390 RepID=UPI0030FB567B
MLYTIEIIPNHELYQSETTLSVETDFENWKKRVLEEIQCFYINKNELDIIRIVQSIYTNVSEGKEGLITIELHGATFHTLVTGRLSAPQFQKLIIRHTHDIFHRIESEKLNERSILFHWFETENFQKDTFRYVMERFRLQDYSFLELGSFQVLSNLHLSPLIEDLIKTLIRGEKVANESIKEKRLEFVERDLFNCKWVLPQDRLAFIKYKNELSNRYKLTLEKEHKKIV